MVKNFYTNFFMTLHMTCSCHIPLKVGNVCIYDYEELRKNTYSIIIEIRLKILSLQDLNATIAITSNTY